MDRNPNPKQVPLSHAMAEALRTATETASGHLVYASHNTSMAMVARGLVTSADVAPGFKLTAEGVRVKGMMG